VIRWLAGAFLVALSARAPAQVSHAARTELRVDGLTDPAALQLGGGVARPVSTYARLAVVAAAGPSWHSGRQSVGGRLDLLGRFVVDPFNENGRGMYASGGLSVRYDEFREWRPVLVVALGIEGPVRHGRAWAAEIGLGGGVRVGLVLRWMRGEGR
jgi:hypothetical protein